MARPTEIMNPTPEQMAEMWSWYQDRKRQQISFPLDEASRNSLGVPTKVGPGGHALTQSVDTSGVSTNVPAAYAGTIIVLIEGAQYEIPYL